MQYDTQIDAASLSPGTYTVSVFEAARGGGMMSGPGPAGPGNSQTMQPSAMPRNVAAIYTNGEPALSRDRKSVPGAYVIIELVHDVDLSTASTDSDKVAIVQNKSVRTAAGTIYPASKAEITNSTGRGQRLHRAWPRCLGTEPLVVG